VISCIIFMYTDDWLSYVGSVALTKQSGDNMNVIPFSWQIWSCDINEVLVVWYQEGKDGVLSKAMMVVGGCGDGGKKLEEVTS
jgi:hypothetical protein